MIGIIFDIAIYTSHWVLNKTYHGLYYMYYGKPENPVIKKLNELEYKLENKTISSQASIEQEFYWANKDKFNQNYWVVISQQKVLLQIKNKTQALRFIADKEDKNPSPHLLVQVGRENNMCYI